VGSKSKTSSKMMSLMPSRDKKNGVESMTNEEMEFHAEIALYCQLRHPNIVLYLGSTKKSPDAGMCIIMEFLGKGELHSFLVENGDELPWPLRYRITKDVALGMRYLHEHNPQVLHCDLKPQNVLLSGDSGSSGSLTAKLCDFGLGSMGKDLSNCNEIIGSLFFLGPEVMEGHFYPASDVYSFACIMYEVLVCKSIYYHLAGKVETAMEVALMVLDDGARPKIPSSRFPDPYVRLMEQCWAQRYEARPTFRKITEQLEAMGSDSWAREDGLMSLSETDKVIEIVRLRRALKVATESNSMQVQDAT